MEVDYKSMSLGVVLGIVGVFAILFLLGAPAFMELNGLKSKVWLSDEENNVYGGIYTWENLQNMNDYMTSSFYDEVLGNNPSFVNITSKAFEVLDGPTRITNP